jgi:tetratricopeptide (TPR) repeat protein
MNLFASPLKKGVLDCAKGDDFPMPLSGDQIHQIQAALSAAFTVEELDQLVRIHLEVDREDITLAKDRQAVLFDLITWCDRTGKLGKLLQAAAAERPDRNAPFREPGIADQPAAGIPDLRALYQLPAPPADFKDREEDLAYLIEAVQKNGAAVLGIYGMPGVGKTALALKLAESLISQYPGAQLFFNLRGNTQKEALKPEQMMEQAIHAFAPGLKTPEDAEELANLYRSMLNGRRGLLLLDNAWGSAQVEPLLPPAGWLTILTSWRRIALSGMRLRNLDVLQEEDAAALLQAISPRAGDHAARLAELCGYLPMALRVVGSLLATRDDLSPAHLARRMGAAPLKELGQVAAALNVSYELLKKPIRRTLRCLSIFQTGFDRQACEAVCGLKPGAVEDQLGELLNLNLVIYNAEANRYRLHDLVRSFASQKLSADERALAHLLHALYYRQILDRADAYYQRGGPGVMEGLRLFDREWPNIQAGFAWAQANAARDKKAADLCSDYPYAGFYCMDLRLNPRERIRWLEAGLDAARRLGDLRAQANHLLNLASAYIYLGKGVEADAFYNDALKLFEKIGDRLGACKTLGGLGNAFYDQGKFDQAGDFFVEWLKIAREIGDSASEAGALGGLGNVASAQNELQKAISFYEQQLAITRKTGNRREEGSALGNLGNACFQSGDGARAAEFYRQALHIDQEIGDRDGESIDSWNLGDVYAAQQDLANAVAAKQVYVDYLEKIGHPDYPQRKAELDTLKKKLQEK